MASLRQSAIALDLPYRTVVRWIRDYGLIRPRAYGGKHYERIPWGDKEQRELKVVGELRKFGISTQQVKAILKFLRQLGHNPASSGQFVVLTDRKGRLSDVVKVCDSGEVLSLIRDRGQLLLLIPGDCLAE